MLEGALILAARDAQATDSRFLTRHKYAFTATPNTSLTHSLASIPSPSHNGFSIGPLFVHVYGLMYIVGVAAAIAITHRRWERLVGDRQLVYEVAMWGFPAGIMGGRI